MMVSNRLPALLLFLAVSCCGTANAFSPPTTQRLSGLYVSVTASDFASGSEESAQNVETAPPDWEEVCKGVFAEDKRPVILFDGACNLCHGGVNFALDHDTTGGFCCSSLSLSVCVRVCVFLDQFMRPE